MFRLFSYKPLIDDDRAMWIRRMWQRFDGVWGRKKSRFILPTREHFLPPDQVAGEFEEDIVRSFAERVRDYMGIEPFDYELEGHASASAISDAVAGFGALSADNPAGTFSTDEQGLPIITYDPILLERPIDLIATLAHELSHYLMHRDGVTALDGAQQEEFATDLCVIYHAMGIFQLRSVFRMESRTEGNWHSWSIQRSGYLTMPEVAYGVAWFAEVNGCAHETVLNHLEDLHYRTYQKAVKQIGHERRTGVIRL